MTVTERIRMVNVKDCGWMELTIMFASDIALMGLDPSAVRYGWLVPDTEEKPCCKCATCFNDECREDRPR